MSRSVRRTMPVVAVTGAGGFVGGVVADELEATGYRVVRLTRRDIPGHPEAVRWDLRRDAPTDLPRADAVVHCAANVKTVDADHTMREANVGGTRRVLAAWPGAPVVFISSASVYPTSDTAHGGRPLAEDDASGEGMHDAYSHSKFDAERVVVEEAEATGRRATLLRASIVYGPGDRMILPRIRRMRLGRIVLLPGGRRLWSMTPVGLLALAARAALEKPASGVRVYNVAEEPPERVRDLFRRLLEDDAGRRLLPVPLPAWPVTVAAACAEAWFRIFRRGRAPLLSRSAVAYIREERVLDCSRLTTLVGEAAVARKP